MSLAAAVLVVAEVSAATLGADAPADSVVPLETVSVPEAAVEVSVVLPLVDATDELLLVPVLTVGAVASLEVDPAETEAVPLELDAPETDVVSAVVDTTEGDVASAGAGAAETEFVSVVVDGAETDAVAPLDVAGEVTDASADVVVTAEVAEVSVGAAAFVVVGCVWVDVEAALLTCVVVSTVLDDDCTVVADVVPLANDVAT